MIVDHARWDSSGGWHPGLQRSAGADLVIYFGSRSVLANADRYDEMRSAYPQATIVGCSATRSIAGETLDEDVVVAVALGFVRTPIRSATVAVSSPSESRAAGTSIGDALVARDLAGILVLADGLLVDGSEFTAGLSEVTGSDTLIVGGMASDPRDYREVLVGVDRAPESGRVAAVGFYGDAIRFGHGRASGWEPFGPRRRVTRSSGNVIYDLDGKPAYELYERYLAEELSVGAAVGGVVFPLEIAPPEHPESTLVRAPLAIGEGPASMTFAGHVPQGWVARLMRGNTDRLIFAAADAARQARGGLRRAESGDALALIVSCAGRHQTMGQRTEEELEVVAAELGRRTTSIGFYSYGEISPMTHSRLPQVHNQTITITVLEEIEA